MFRNRPLLFLVLLLLIVVGVFAYSTTKEGLFLLLALAGVLALFVWWIKCIYVTLILTSEGIIYRRGILAKHTNGIAHSNVRLIRIDQSLIQRLLNVGSVSIASAGIAEVEIEVHGISNPEKVRKIVESNRAMSRQVSQGTSAVGHKAKKKIFGSWFDWFLLLTLCIALLYFFGVVG